LSAGSLTAGRQAGVADLTGACLACPVAPGDGTGVKFFEKDSRAYLTGVAHVYGTGAHPIE